MRRGRADAMKQTTTHFDYRTIEQRMMNPPEKLTPLQAADADRFYAEVKKQMDVAIDRALLFGCSMTARNDCVCDLCRTQRKVRGVLGV